MCSLRTSVCLSRLSSGWVPDAAGGIFYIHTVQYWGKDGALRHPTPVSLGVDNSPSTDTSNFLFVRKGAISLMRPAENFNSDSLYSRPEYHVVPKAFSMSKNSTATDILLLKFIATWSVSLIHWSAALWCAQKPKWLAFSKSVPSMCLWIVHKIIFSKSLPTLDKRLNAHKFWGENLCPCWDLAGL
jgi:hypothetical protein